MFVFLNPAAAKPTGPMDVSYNKGAENIVVDKPSKTFVLPISTFTWHLKGLGRRKEREEIVGDNGSKKIKPANQS